MYRLRTLGGFSIEQDNVVLDQIRVHRKAHALLAVLATQGGTSRERLVTLLWPESDAERGKGSLKQAIHLLRRELAAPELLLGTAELRLNPEQVESDVGLFVRAFEAGDVAAAVRNYGGPFLDGVYLDRSSEFERWVESQRADLARKHMAALEQLARAAELQGVPPMAAEWWRRLQAVDPLNSRVAVNLMMALEAAGDRAAALQHARIHETLVVEEWGITPDPAVGALAERLRSNPPRPAAAKVPAGPSPTPPPPADRVSTVIPTAAAAQPGAVPAFAGSVERGGVAYGRRWRRAGAAVVAAVLLLAAGYALAALYGRDGRPEAPILAVGRFEEHGSTAPTDVAAAAADMLATNLARVPGLQVVSSARMYEILGQLGDTAGGRGSTADAARRAGAGELLEGALHHTPDGGLRLDLRRVDLRTGAVLGASITDASDVFQLVDRATAELARGYGVSAGELHLAEVSTTSLVAYRFYEEGLRSFAEADYRTAQRLFEAAVGEDSLFAMATHYLWATREALHGIVPDSARERLRRLTERAPDRERLLMRAHWTPTHDGQHRLAEAESLALRYPTEPEGHLLLAANRIGTGDFLGALPHLQRVVSLDSLGLRGTRPDCRACNALSSMVNAYLNGDSLAAAERAAREWVRYRPRSAGAWAALASILALQDRPEEALAARRTAATLNPIDHSDPIFPAMVRIRTGDFATADGLLRDLARDGAPDVQREAVWWLTISLRHQGRLREALATIRRPSHDTSGRAAFPTLLLEGQVRFELGDFAAAARTFQSAAELKPHDPRRVSWALTHQATSLAAAGDTARLAALADTIEALGRLSSFGRDWLLHHHVRGLLLAARGRTEPAIGEFRRAIFSPTTGYTRTNLELARVLLAAGRPHEAVAVLQPAFRGLLDSSNLYVTHTDLHALLGHAWEAAGRPDSAAVHYRWVLDAWRAADPELHARRDSVRARLRE
ncbi:hypothetical protein BH23GEM9_BH23GEM9_26990 [soil metagenome]